MAARKSAKPGFDQQLFKRLVHAGARLSHWAHKARDLEAQGKIEQARRAFRTAERWQVRVKDYERRLDQRSTQFRR